MASIPKSGTQAVQTTDRSKRRQVERFNVPMESSISHAFIIGCGAGILGVAAMTVGEKIEQLFTHRPNSLVPGYTLRALLGLSRLPENQMFSWNMLMHYGQGALVGGVRGIMTFYGITGFFANFMFTGIRLLTDQTLENLTGVGALPWTWPRNEQVIDVLHKSVFAFVTGWLADMWVR